MSKMTVGDRDQARVADWLAEDEILFIQIHGWTHAEGNRLQQAR
jgi:hypothetical protein